MIYWHTRGYSKDIIDKMEYDLNGGDKTGFNPYIKEGQICFDHRWLLLIGKKETNSVYQERNFQFRI